MHAGGVSGTCDSWPARQPATHARPACKAPQGRGARPATPRAAGVAGIVFAVLFVIALELLRKQVGVGLDTQTVMDNLNSGQTTAALLGLYMIPFAGMAFLWFIGVIRDRIGDREDRFFATVFLGSGLIFVAMLFAGAAVLGGLVGGHALRHRCPDRHRHGGVRALGRVPRSCSRSRPKAEGCSCLATSTIVRRANWPRWTYVSGLIVAAALILSISFFEPIVLLLPAWVGAISVYVLATGGRRSQADVAL